MTTAKQALSAVDVAIRRAQTILDTQVDGDFGPASRARWKALRALAKAKPDAEYPPSDPEAYGGPWPRWDDGPKLRAFFTPIKLTKITPPYPLRIFIDGGWKPMKSLTCHVKVAESLMRILSAIKKHYGGDMAKIKAVGMDVCEGVYVDRPVTGGRRKSMHGYGAAIDFDAEHNALGSSSSRMPASVIAIFEKEGWRWGGDYSGRKDPMHFEACR